MSKPVVVEVFAPEEFDNLPCTAPLDGQAVLRDVVEPPVRVKSTRGLQWRALLSCGHNAYRNTSYFKKPPMRVACGVCSARCLSIDEVTINEPHAQPKEYR